MTSNHEDDKTLNTLSQHLLVEYHGCESALLNDVERIEHALRSAAEAAQATVVSAAFHRFSPQGVSGVVVIAESHLSIHTWPENGYAAVDFYTCGECLPEKAHEFLRDQLGAERAEVMRIDRGIAGRPGMQVADHYSEAASDSAAHDEGDGTERQGRPGASDRDEQPLSVAEG